MLSLKNDCRIRARKLAKIRSSKYNRDKLLVSRINLAYRVNDVFHPETAWIGWNEDRACSSDGGERSREGVHAKVYSTKYLLHCLTSCTSTSQKLSRACESGDGYIRAMYAVVPKLTTSQASRKDISCREKEFKYTYAILLSLRLQALSRTVNLQIFSCNLNIPSKWIKAPIPKKKKSKSKQNVFHYLLHIILLKKLWKSSKASRTCKHWKYERLIKRRIKLYILLIKNKQKIIANAPKSRKASSACESSR